MYQYLFPDRHSFSSTLSLFCVAHFLSHYSITNKNISPQIWTYISSDFLTGLFSPRRRFCSFCELTMSVQTRWTINFGLKYFLCAGGSSFSKGGRFTKFQFENYTSLSWPSHVIQELMDCNFRPPLARRHRSDAVEMQKRAWECSKGWFWSLWETEYFVIFLVLKKLKLWDFMLRFSSVLAAISKINSVDAKILKTYDILCIDLFDVQDYVEINPSHVAFCLSALKPGKLSHNQAWFTPVI